TTHYYLTGQVQFLAEAGTFGRHGENYKMAIPTYYCGVYVARLVVVGEYHLMGWPQWSLNVT
ncbi:hypothetical protein NY486_19610, partial [Enterobacter hormaechei]|nr:hypothetical protein [Enterobacter hormaechei]